LNTIHIDTPSRPYEVHVGHGAASIAGEVLRGLGVGVAHIVTDENTRASCLSPVAQSLKAAGIAFSESVLRPGEEHKNLIAVEGLWEDFSRAGLDRSCAVLALGGGVCGDVAGFGAACYMRGITLLQMPTSLIGMVDASVGGKCGVNTPAGKNLIGAFYQPSSVIIDTAFLLSLPGREMRSGMAEVVKYYALGERRLKACIEEGFAAGASEAVSLCVESKARFVAGDEEDRGLRRLLNFGHSFGHAIESVTAYESYRHGEALAMGIALALDTGRKMGITDAAAAEEILHLLSACGLECSLPFPPSRLLSAMAKDKKNEGGQLKLILLENIGEVREVAVKANELERLVS